MKLILRQYLSSLRERGELDAILPDLLSQLGLNVFSRPGRGTRQDGVDVGAVGSLDGAPEKVYLFAIKPGDLARRDWDGDAVQSLRPSLNEILDAYIPHRIPPEHRGKDVVICICLGGDIREQVRPQVTGFTEQHTTSSITFEEWNGDRLASLIMSCFLREDLLPESARSDLRKSLALLDEPEVSYRHFAALAESLAAVDSVGDAERITALRQIGICLWVMFGWARDAGNMEAAYLSSELALLHGWKIVSQYAGRKDRFGQDAEAAFFSIYSAYQQVCGEYLTANVLPYVDTLHALSSGVRASSSLDVNLKLFDVLGRLSTYGVWASWAASRYGDGEDETRPQWLDLVSMTIRSVKALISSNPALMLPARDEQAIDVSIAAMLLASDARNHGFVLHWLAEMLGRAAFSYQTHGHYPCVLDSYGDLLSHPVAGDDEYREKATSGSTLYPTIALWAALLGDEETYGATADFKRERLQHCNFQFWYPDESSEAHMYTNDSSHGGVVSNVCVERASSEFLSQVFGECEQSSECRDMSAMKFGWWPLLVVACRHHRLPLPLHLLKGLYDQHENPNDGGVPDRSV